MISGFNTDVEFQGAVYHVQTEDKGRRSGLFVSLVYDRGTILASKRTPYGDLSNGAFDENELSERLQRQHKLICAAVKAGRIADLQKMAAADGPPAGQTKPAPETAHEQHSIPQIDGQGSGAPETQNTETIIPIDLEIIDDEIVFDGISIIEDEAILPAEAVAIVSELSGQERPKNTKLSVELLGETKFKGGDRRAVNIMVCRGTDRKVVQDAQIMIKILGSSFRPMIFHARSDANGLAKVHLHLPNFQSGRAAILIRAMSDGEETELRRAITPS